MTLSDYNYYIYSFLECKNGHIVDIDKVQFFCMNIVHIKMDVLCIIDIIIIFFENSEESIKVQKNDFFC